MESLEYIVEGAASLTSLLLLPQTLLYAIISGLLKSFQFLATYVQSLKTHDHEKGLFSDHHLPFP